MPMYATLAECERIGLPFGDVNLIAVASTSVLACVWSFLTSIAGLPEVDGE